jgi:hypothetical protein
MARSRAISENAIDPPILALIRIEWLVCRGELQARPQFLVAELPRVCFLMRLPYNYRNLGAEFKTSMARNPGVQVRKYWQLRVSEQ